MSENEKVDVLRARFRERVEFVAWFAEVCAVIAIVALAARLIVYLIYGEV